MGSHRLNIPYVQPEVGDPGEVLPVIGRILSSGRLTKGEVVRRYEAVLAERLQVGHVVATASCTTGLALLYRALGLNGKVIVPSFTFMATVHALVWAGGTPVFVDVDEATFNIDPQAVSDAMTPDVVGVIAVPVFGVPCDVTALEKVAAEHGVPLVFDSAHGVGSSYDGRPLGGHGVAEVFSTTPTKTLVTGEGGFIATDDASLAASLLTLTEYGNDGSFDCDVPGLNGRLAEINAAIGLQALDRLDTVLAGRRRVAARYRDGLSGVAGVRFQHVPDNSESSYKDFTIVLQDEFPLGRDELREFLHSRGIDTRAYFFPSVHRQRCYRSLGYEGKLPVTENLEKRVVSLPMWSGLTADQVDAVVDAIADAGSHPSTTGRTSPAPSL